jgi:hypothetical protein
MLYVFENHFNYAGCFQSVHSLYTFRIESIAHGKPSPVDELQFHGVHAPDLLRKVTIICNCEKQSYKGIFYNYYSAVPSYIVSILFMVEEESYLWILDSHKIITWVYVPS